MSGSFTLPIDDHELCYVHDQEGNPHYWFMCQCGYICSHKLRWHYSVKDFYDYVKPIYEGHLQRVKRSQRGE